MYQLGLRMEMASFAMGGIIWDLFWKQIGSISAADGRDGAGYWKPIGSCWGLLKN